MAARRPVRQLGSPNTPGAVCLPTAGGARHGNVEVCLTPTQMQTLFKGKRPTEIACGTRACVFKPKGARTRLVKLTVDESDVGSLLALQQSGLVPKVYRAFKLRGTTFQPIDPTKKSSAPNHTYDGTTVYAIEVERLQTFEERLAPIKAECESYPGASDDYDRCKERYYAAERAMEDQVSKLKQALEKHRFYWRDDMLANVGFDKAGRMRMIDAGYSDQAAPATLPQLDGSKRRRR